VVGQKCSRAAESQMSIEYGSTLSESREHEINDEFGQVTARTSDCCASKGVLWTILRL